MWWDKGIACIRWKRKVCRSKWVEFICLNFFVLFLSCRRQLPMDEYSHNFDLNVLLYPICWGVHAVHTFHIQILRNKLIRFVIIFIFVWSAIIWEEKNLFVVYVVALHSWYDMYMQFNWTNETNERETINSHFHGVLCARAPTQTYNPRKTEKNISELYVGWI